MPNKENDPSDMLVDRISAFILKTLDRFDSKATIYGAGALFVHFATVYDFWGSLGMTPAEFNVAMGLVFTVLVGAGVLADPNKKLIRK